MVRSKEVISEALIDSGMVPVFYYADVELCKGVIWACYAGGLRVFEYTNRGEKAIQNFPILKRFVADHCNGMMLGIGSINTKAQAEEFIELGTDFIVSPIFDIEIAEACNQHNMYWIPGCGTLSEIAAAMKVGADIVKVFPGNVLGPGFVKAVLGPMPHLKIMPTGGVAPTRENLSAWFEAGVVCVGMGSKLITKERRESSELLEEAVRDAVALISELKKSVYNL